MGGNNSKKGVSTKQYQQKITKDDFEIISTIGEGQYAQVYLVKKKDSGSVYAMKSLNKASLIKKDEVEHTKTERKILAMSKYPFLTKMRYAFQTPEKLYLVMNFVNGGELFTHLKKEKRFTEDRARFYAAEICLGLEYLHKNDIVYRDLKPENVLLDSDGHVVLTDFGLSKILVLEDKTNTFCGTPEYLAPEVLLNTAHGKAVDWWSYGTLLYEMLIGIPPYYSQDIHEMYEMILHAELYIPEVVPPNAKDLLSKLLERDPKKRLGSANDAADIKNHAFFKTVDWNAIQMKRVEPPYKPAVKGPDDLSNVDPSFLLIPPEAENKSMLNSVDQKNFEGFSYAAGESQRTMPNGPSPIGSMAAGSGN